MKINTTILIIIFTTFAFLLKAEALYDGNYGITENTNNKKNIYITVDLCPSHHLDYSEELFQSFIDISKSRNQAIPVAISISGHWLLKHQEALEEIKTIEKNGYIKITWVNHSYAHYDNPSLDNSHNFMIHDISNASNDIDKNRDLMIKNNLTPSNFFRFPGLISNNYLNNLVENKGYKILGASAWLNKTNGKFKGGDIILIHGNKNEERGVKLFIDNFTTGKFNNYNFGSLEDFNE